MNKTNSASRIPRSNQHVYKKVLFPLKSQESQGAISTNHTKSTTDKKSSFISGSSNRHSGNGVSKHTKQVEISLIDDDLQTSFCDIKESQVIKESSIAINAVNRPAPKIKSPAVLNKIRMISTKPVMGVKR